MKWRAPLFHLRDQWGSVAQPRIDRQWGFIIAGAAASRSLLEFQINLTFILYSSPLTGSVHQIFCGGSFPK
jgi:hypothetical protein